MIRLPTPDPAAVRRLVHGTLGGLMLAALPSLADPSQPLPGGAVAEALVSPPTLFPRQWEKKGDPYRPLKAYDRPDGKAFGLVTFPPMACLADPTCLRTPEDGSALLTRPGLPPVALPTALLGYDIHGLISSHAPRRDTAHAWARIDAGHDLSFWVRARNRDVVDVESLNDLAARLDVLCDARGRCKPAAPAFLNALVSAAAALRRDGDCFADHPYRVADRQTIGGRRFYRVVLRDEVPDAHRQALPMSAWIPTRTASGGHTAVYFPKGC